MSVHIKYYYGQPGATYFTDPDLAWSTVLNITRSALTHFLTSNPEASGLQYKFSIAEGKISFDPNNPFSGIRIGGRPIPLSSRERISVKYQI
jgi:hypothetical protein